MDQNEVGIAFDIVLEEIEDVIAALNQEGAQAFQSSKYEAARDLMEQGSRMIAFREKVKDLQKEWSNIFSMVARERVKKKKGGNVSERLKRGLRTTEDNFRAPILEALIALGDSGPVVDVLNKVEILMKDQLNSYDMQPLPSDPSQPRWRNTAQWARNAMVKEGLLSADSPRGVWVITQAGKKWLKENVG